VPSGFFVARKVGNMALSRVGVVLVTEGANTFEAALTRATNLTQRFGSVAQGTAGGFDKMSVGAIALGTALGSLVATGLTKVVTGFQDFVGAGWDFANTIEQATAKLVAFTGSQEAAAEVLEMVRRRAAATPFAFDEMANSAASLAAISRSTGQDLESLIGIAERLAASNPSEGLEGAAFALREAFSGDFMSLQERFNISKDTIARMKEAGVSVETFDLILGELGITTELVTGLAETLQGRWSTFMDSVTTRAAAFTTPIFESVKTILQELQPLLDRSSGSIDEFLGKIGGGIGSNILSGWGLLRDSIITFQQAVAGRWIDDDIVHPLHRLTGVVGTVVGQFDLLGGAFGRLIEGKPIDSYIDAIVRNIATMLNLDLSQFEFETITGQIQSGIDTALGAIETFKLGWGDLTTKVGEFQALFHSEWFKSNIEKPLGAIGEFLVNDFKATWDGFVKGVEDARFQWDELHKAGDEWQGLLDAVNLLMATLNTHFNLLGKFLGISKTELGNNTKEMDEMVTAGTLLEDLFSGLTVIVLGWTTIIQNATKALMAFVSWAKIAYDAATGFVDTINNGAEVFGEAYGNSQPVDPIVSEAQANAQGNKQIKAPATGNLAPTVSNTKTSNSVVIQQTIVAPDPAAAGMKAQEGAVTAMRSVGLA
jgi:hypothetical protein